MLVLFPKIILAETKLLGTEKYWKAYSTKMNKNKTCFITSEPIKSDGKFNKNNRGKPYVFVHEKRQIKFCCIGCDDEFNSNTEKYIKKFDLAVEKNKAASNKINTPTK